MKLINRHIFLLFMALTLAGMAVSCVNDNYPDSDGGNDNKDKIFLVLNVSPVSTRSSGASVTEKIQSLRIIILDTDRDSLEVNHYVDLNDENSEPLPVDYFTYNYTWPTEKGNKKIYLVANEESVNDLKFQPLPGVTLPQGQPAANLTGLLDTFKAGKGKTGDFINTMDAIYFQPVYQGNEDNEIFLPYVSVYDIVAKEGIGNETICTTYLVPVATKFTFQFINSRTAPVNIDEITVSSAADLNFLFARVGTSDMYKDLITETSVQRQLYWVDWLAQISALSNQYSDYYPNINFNEEFGWISNFSLPTSHTINPMTFVNNSDAPIPIPAAGVEDPGELILGPFYVPESINTYTYTDRNNNQVTDTGYFLTLRLSDNSVQQPPVFEDVMIDNLHSLFRNTSVIIIVKMSHGNVDIYAEISDWGRNYASGWVTEDSDDDDDSEVVEETQRGTWNED